MSRGYDRAKFIEKCQSKGWYESQAEALQHAIYVGNRDGPRLRPYQCVICRLWHLSKKGLDLFKREALERMEAEYQAEARRRYRAKET